MSIGTITFTVTAPEDYEGESATSSDLYHVTKIRYDQNMQIEELNGSRPAYKYFGRGKVRPFQAIIRVNDANHDNVRTAIDAWESLEGFVGTVVITDLNGWTPDPITQAVLTSVERPEKLPPNSVQVVLSFAGL